jgi:hypothetical protein
MEWNMPPEDTLLKQSCFRAEHTDIAEKKLLEKSLFILRVLCGGYEAFYRCGCP